MNTRPQPLPPPDSYDPSSSMWVDEGIWGHRLYDEQVPWMVFLEFLNVFHHENDKNRAFEEPAGFNTLTYRAAHRLYLRNILFNNPDFADILLSSPNDDTRWAEWIKRMKPAQGIANPQFAYLRSHFQSFEDFGEVASLVRSTSLEVDSNKRWTSKFVFPYGRDCLYEDLDKEARTNDRRFFGRTGELLYLMLCRASCKRDLLALLNSRLLNADPRWNSIIKCLQPTDDDVVNGDRPHAFLPYVQHRCFDHLAEDWLAILRLNIPAFDVFPHLVNLAGLHLVKYQLTASCDLISSGPMYMVCEVIAPKRTLVREISCDLYQENNDLPEKAIQFFISSIAASPDWQQALTEDGAYQRCREILWNKARWSDDDYDGPRDPIQLIAAFRQRAMARHRQHVANIHRIYGREIGLVSKRGTVKLRYAPNDALLKTLLFANVERRIELHQWLEKLYRRYGLVFGDREAEQVLAKGEIDKKAFQANSRRLEQRLGSLGLLRRLSDGCAYVVNPYHVEAQ